MQKPLQNYAFIDGQNVHMAIKDLGWSLDWKRFRIYLKEKYAVGVAYMFLGYLEEQQNLYRSLQKSGFILIFKDVLRYKNGTVKGNCDAELVLQAMIDYEEYEKAVIITGDGDFSCLVRHLFQKNKLEKLVIPDSKKYSSLLKKNIDWEKIAFLNPLERKLSYPKGNSST